MHSHAYIIISLFWSFKSLLINNLPCNRKLSRIEDRNDLEGKEDFPVNIVNIVSQKSIKVIYSIGAPSESFILML